MHIAAAAALPRRQPSLLLCDGGGYSSMFIHIISTISWRYPGPGTVAPGVIPDLDPQRETPHRPPPPPPIPLFFELRFYLFLGPTLHQVPYVLLPAARKKQSKAYR